MWVQDLIQYHIHGTGPQQCRITQQHVIDEVRLATKRARSFGVLSIFTAHMQRVRGNCYGHNVRAT